MMLCPELLIRIAQQVPEPLARWQTAATLAMAGAFGREWKGHLRGLWADEARAFGSSPETGPYHTVNDLRRAALRCGYPARGLKKAELRALVPQSVPLGIVYVARETLREHRVARDVRLYSAADEDDRITATDAKTTYCLTEGDLDGVLYEPCRNPHYRSGPPMRLYNVRDVVVAAYERHGGKAGLAAAQAAARARRGAREARRAAERAAHEAQRAAERWAYVAQREARCETLLSVMTRAGLADPSVDHPLAAAYVTYGNGSPDRVVACLQRDQVLRAALAGRGMVLRRDSRLCEAFVLHGEGDVALIVDVMDEMRFYHTHTNYAVCREQIYRQHRNMDAGDVSERAKERAWRTTLERRTKDWLLTHLPPSLRRRLETSSQE